MLLVYFIQALKVKLEHAIGFLSEDMKVKVALKFRGREMAHTEYGFQVVQTFLAEIAPYGHPDYEPKLIGRGIIVMVTPLPRNKRAKAPQPEGGEGATAFPQRVEIKPPAVPVPIEQDRRLEAEEAGTDGFVNNPFAQLEITR